MKKKRKIVKSTLASKLTQTSKLSGESLDIKAEQIEKLKSLFPQAIKDGKVDFDALKQALGEEIAANGERYGLGWAGKADCFGHIQQATSATLRPVKEESVDFDTSENLFIEGDNLQVLKVLQKSYYGKVKMIYIDPPYNTGSDSFIYPDRFKESKEDYLQRVGEKDTEGNLMKDGFFRKNSKDAGHFHSNWLSMMYPRLFLARNLLKEDGVIFVSIDDNEVHNLKMIMNEIFGEESFITDIIWEKRFTRSNDAKLMASIIDHILLYRKSEALSTLREPRTEKANSIYSNPDDDPRGAWTSVSYVSQRTKAQRKNLSYKVRNPFKNEEIEHPTNAWKYSYEQHKTHVKENRLYWGKEGGHQYPRLKKYLNELQTGLVPINLWDYKQTGSIDVGTKEVDVLIGKDIFDYPKPTTLISRMMKMAMGKGSQDIILDFFAGSCSTAHAVMQLNAEDGGNRKYICVQLAEPCDEKSEAFKAGYKTIADIGKERIRRAGKKIKAENTGKLDFDGGKLDLGFKVFKLDESNFKQWRTDIKTADELKKQMSLFIDNVRPDAAPEDILYELILKTGLDLNVTVEAKKANGKQYFVIDDGRLIICLTDKITKPLIEKITKTKPQKFICLDRAFGNNDQLKTNTALQMEAAGIEFKVI